MSVAADFSKKIRDFNKSHRRFFVDVEDVITTRGMLQAAQLAVYEEALALFHSNVALSGRRTPAPVSVYAVLTKSAGQLGDTDRYSVRWLEMPSDAPTFSYDVRLDLDEIRGWGVDEVASTFNIDASDHLRSGHSTAEHMLAEWLGYDSGEVTTFQFSP